MSPFPDSQLDERSRELIISAARLLRSISPPDPRADLVLHDIARVLERMAAGETINPPGALLYLPPKLPGADEG